MPKSIAFLAITLLFMGSGEAQQGKEDPCRLRFAVAEGNSRDRWGVWPEDARKWWSEEGGKKFPELCETTSQGADFVIEWLRKQSTEERYRPKGDQAWPAAPAYDCDTRPGETVCHAGPNEQLICSTGPPKTTCTYRPAELLELEVYSIEV
ncbi:MAG: hypothetical protein JJE04_00655 [Acidobacteriia bacterium]|nr:hypothetical protein [Terriglobia bacterium]